MSYRAPDTTISICYGVPLDNSYKNTLYFSVQSAQEEYFQGKVLYTYDKYSYQRVGLGKIRVGTMAESLYSCNYLFFRNMDSAGSKWFYCFITDVAYINENVSEITYEIDVMQTYHFNYELGQCFVEREHVTDDTIGANLMQEPFNLGDIKCSGMASSGLFDVYSIVLATGYDPDGVPGEYRSGLPSGLNYMFFSGDSSGTEELAETIQTFVDAEKDDSIVSIWMQPYGFATSKDSEATDDIRVISLEDPTTIDGYTPKNNKLFTYPYNYLAVDCEGDIATYRYEWFNTTTSSGNKAVFALMGCCSPNAEYYCVPYGYNLTEYDESSSAQLNYTEALIMKGFPQLGWATDAYRAWVANGGYETTTLSVLTSGASMAGGLATGNPFLATSGAIGIGSTLNSAIHQANKGATGHGTQSGSISVAGRTKDFYFKRMQVQREYAEMIDNYFTMYGYAVNKVKVPSIDGRLRWNYVKTQNCIVKSIAIPADDVAKIESIFNSGVTFWRYYTGFSVGDYSLTNPVQP